MAKDEKTGTKKSRRERNRDKTKAPTKIVIRHLPPTMTEEEFLKQIDPLPEYDFYYFSAADWSLGFDATCRAYITFKKYDDVFLFRDRFDGYVFVDNKGNEYAAIVEFAPFQGFVKNKSRSSDNKVDTIEQELHYQQFLTKLEEDREAVTKGGESKLEFSLDCKKEEITSTPLLQYLASKKEKRREESKKRTAEKKKRREEEKEKRKQSQAPAPSQPVKVLTADSNNKSEKVEPKSQQTREEPKNSRARRREERNRLRHEAYLQKKKALKEQQNNKDVDSEKDDVAQSKKDDEKAGGDRKESAAKTSESNKPIEILKKTKPVDMLTESVRNFIFTAATTLTASTATPDNPTDKSSTSKDVDKPKENLEKLQETVSNMTSDQEENDFDNPSTEKQQEERNKDVKKLQEDMDKFQEAIAKLDLNDEETETKCSAKDYEQEAKDFERLLTEKQQEERREERRIRNKDRPSIAIYQPKARLRLSEESDSNSNSKELVRSLSVSDCETAKKDDQPPRHKKVQRYSERSKNRRKSLTKDGGEEDNK